ncbi:hypothetical protein EDI29_09045 [Pectobacterium polonicum]|nr:hypothetical protein EDI29_09045 [Pectobacterium polonicum]
MIRVTNLPGADLNAACSGPNGARLMDEPSNGRSQHTYSLKYDGYIDVRLSGLTLSPLLFYA